MSDKIKVLVDTSFLIALSDRSSDNYEVANKYYKYCLNPRSDVQLYLSTIVISEYHQLTTALTWVNSGNFIPLPFNVKEALEISNIAHALGSNARAESRKAEKEGVQSGARAEYKDDLKLIAQASVNKIDFIITDDKSTLANYIQKLNQAGIISCKTIVSSDSFDSSHFTGQRSMLDDPLLDTPEHE